VDDEGELYYRERDGSLAAHVLAGDVEALIARRVCLPDNSRSIFTDKANNEMCTQNQIC
jgi:hypothetical protein